MIIALGSGMQVRSVLSTHNLWLVVTEVGQQAQASLDSSISTKADSASNLERPSHIGRFWIGVSLLSVSLLVIVAIWANSQFGSVEMGLRWICGETMAISPPRVVLGNASAGSVSRGVVTVHNLSGQPLRVLGALGECNCMVVSNLPIEIEGRARREITIDVNNSDQQGEFEYSMIFYTDRDVNHPLRVLVSSVVE